MPWLTVTCEKCERVVTRYQRPSKAASFRDVCSATCRWPVRSFTCRACGDQFQRRISKRKRAFSFCSRRCAGVPPIGAAHRKWEFTPPMDAAIRDVFMTRGRGQKIPALLARDPAFALIPRYMIWHRSRILGVAPVADKRPWSGPEKKILGEHAGDLCVEQIKRRLAAAGFRRTTTAIATRIWRGEVGRGSTVGATMTAPQIARLLGWAGSTVLDWIKSGRLASVPHGRVHRVHRSMLAAFVRREADALGTHRADLAALIGLLDDYPWHSRRGGDAAAEA